MNALVTLLDHEKADTIRDIWWELETEFGVTTRYVKPFVHFSYHVVADEYELQYLSGTLEDVSDAYSAFTVPTTKVDVFLGAEPVVFLGVARTPELDRLHKELWSACTPGFGVALPYYSPEVWVPHITLAQGPRVGENLPEILKALEARDLSWELPVSNLAVIEDGGQERGLLYEIQLNG